MTIKKAVLIGTLGAILVGLTAFALNHKEYKPKIQATYAEDLETANGNWYFNNKFSNTAPDGTDLTTTGSYNINYYIDATDLITGESIYIINFANTDRRMAYYVTNSLPLQDAGLQIVYTYNPVNAYTNWSSEKQQKRRAIKITGGNDTTNPQFIEWLKNNATRLPDTLQNTAWKINQNPKLNSGTLYTIDFYCNGTPFNYLTIGSESTEYALKYRTNNQYWPDQNDITVYNNTGWQTYRNAGYRQLSEIYITENTQNENELKQLHLITWFFKNAKQQEYIRNLTNTKWQFIQNPKPFIWQYHGKTYFFDFTSNNSIFAYINIEDDGYIRYMPYQNDGQTTTEIIAYDTFWHNDRYRTIILTKSSDSEKIEFISFLMSNAESKEYTPIPTGTTNTDIENGNFISLQKLMINILTMPFTFIAQAFNVTLWPNTAWEFNLSNFILSLIAIATILFIIKLFTTGLTIFGNYDSTRAETKLTKSKTKLNKQKYKQNKEKKE